MSEPANYAILAQYRNKSDYKDRIGELYHFPKKYFNALTLPNTAFIYYEPQSASGEYFGFGMIGEVYADPDNSDHFYARIENYHPFPTPVPFLKADGTRYEASRYFNATNAVRKLEAHEFEFICLAGGIDPDQFGIDESENTSSNEPITDPFDPSKIKVDREPMTVFQALRKIDRGEIDIQPKFQRHFVWDLTRQSRLIESILLRIPLPAFYLDAPKSNKWVVVDGLQRLTTLYAFMHQETLRLEGLEYLKNLTGLSFPELPHSYRTELEDCNLTLFLIRPDTPPEVKFTIFYRINTGGLVLNGQEIRHALFQGDATALLDDLSQDPDFLKATNYSINTKRMDDTECVLRFLAFYLTPYRNYNKSDLNYFLSLTMDRINNQTSSERDQLKKAFISSMRKCHSVLGVFAFRKFDRTINRKGPINKALFESWSNSVMPYEEDKLVEKREAIANKLEDALTTNNAYIKSLSVSTGSPRQVFSRFSITEQILKEALS